MPAKTTISYSSPEGQPGMLATGTPYIIRGTLEENVNGHSAIAIPAGSATVYDPAAPRKKYLPGQPDTPASAVNFGGVTVVNEMYGVDAGDLTLNQSGCPPSQPLDTISLGDIWLQSEVAVQKGLPVAYKTIGSQAGQSYGTAAGSSFAVIPDAYWLSTTAGSGLAIATFKTIF